MKKLLTNKSIPFIILIFLIGINWYLEAVFFDLRINKYNNDDTYLSHHTLTRSLELLIIFILGYVGLSFTKYKWQKKVWILFYILIFLSAGLNKLLHIFWAVNLNSSFYQFFVTIYTLGLTPAIYLFLILFEYILGNLANSTK
jgi:hypothetical protein